MRISATGPSWSVAQTAPIVVSGPDACTAVIRSRPTDARVGGTHFGDRLPAVDRRSGPGPPTPRAGPPTLSVDAHLRRVFAISASGWGPEMAVPAGSRPRRRSPVAEPLLRRASPSVPRRVATCRGAGRRGTRAPRRRWRSPRSGSRPARHRPGRRWSRARRPATR